MWLGRGDLAPTQELPKNDARVLNTALKQISEVQEALQVLAAPLGV
jgi:hypothetical protein